MSRGQKDILALKGKIHWEGDLDAMRTDIAVAEEQADYDANAG